MVIGTFKPLFSVRTENLQHLGNVMHPTKAFRHVDFAKYHEEFEIIQIRSHGKEDSALRRSWTIMVITSFEGMVRRLHRLRKDIYLDMVSIFSSLLQKREDFIVSDFKGEQRGKDHIIVHQIKRLHGNCLHSSVIPRWLFIKCSKDTLFGV